MPNKSLQPTATAAAELYVRFIINDLAVMKMKKILFSLTILVLICGLLEISLRIAGSLYIKKMFVHDWKHLQPSDDEINIVCLGESSTAGYVVGYDKSYPKQLQRLLNKHYKGKRIKVFVPPLIGQNTSQMANRIHAFIKGFKPKVILIMAGYNNDYSLPESHITKFLNKWDFRANRIRAEVLLSNLRIYKVFKYIYLNHIIRKKTGYANQLKTSYYAWGGPEHVWDPKKWIPAYTQLHKEELIKLWKYDMKEMISAAKEYNVEVILMTYHIMPFYLSAEEADQFAKDEGVEIIRNDKTFMPFIKNGSIREYLLDDHWHPNERGYSLIANNALQTIVKNNVLGIHE